MTKLKQKQLTDRCVPLSKQTVKPEKGRHKIKSFRCWRADDYVIKILKSRGWSYRGEISQLDDNNKYLRALRLKKKEGKIDQRRCLWWTDDKDPGALVGASERHIIAGHPGCEKALTKVSQSEMFRNCDWFPKCFILPVEKKNIEKYMKDHPNSFWIMKPRDAYGGRKIVVYKGGSNELENIIENPPWKEFVIQKYIKSPLLIGGYKFHIRAYAVITDVLKPKCYLYKLGQVEFATRPFNLEEVGDKFNKYSHITNMCVNIEKQNMPFYKKDKAGVGVGTEWSLRKLLDILPTYLSNFDEETFWFKLKDIATIVLEKLSSHPEVQRCAKKTIPGCHFQLYGLDCLMDEIGDIFLTEGNTRPGMDYTDEVLPDGTKVPNVVEGNAVTRNVIHDTITLLGIDEWSESKSNLPFIAL